jgi:hypothetical protein
MKFWSNIRDIVRKYEIRVVTYFPCSYSSLHLTLAPQQPLQQQQDSDEPPALNGEQLLNLRIGGKYSIGRKIGSGAFGDIHIGSQMPFRVHSSPFSERIILCIGSRTHIFIHSRPFVSLTRLVVLISLFCNFISSLRVPPARQV